MNIAHAVFFFLTAPVLAFTSCRQQQASPAPLPADTVSAADTADLVLALTPTMENLPVYYAQHAGIFNKLGLKVHLATYASQFDCDTAILGGTAVGGSSDLLRLQYYAAQGKKLSAVTATNGTWGLVVSGDLRIRKTGLLNNRMVAGSRFSASDYWGKEAIQSAGLAYEEVFHPQINDLRMRAAMLKNHQIDAAILPDPFLTQARQAGHHLLKKISSDAGNMGCLLFKSTALAQSDTAAMISTFLRGYNQAVAELNQKGRVGCNEILRKEYQVAATVADSLTLPKYARAALPANADVQKSISFLKEHGNWEWHELPSDSLFNGTFLPK